MAIGGVDRMTQLISGVFFFLSMFELPKTARVFLKIQVTQAYSTENFFFF